MFRLEIIDAFLKVLKGGYLEVFFVPLGQVFLKYVKRAIKWRLWYNLRYILGHIGPWIYRIEQNIKVKYGEIGGLVLMFGEYARRTRAVCLGRG